MLRGSPSLADWHLALGALAPSLGFFLSTSAHASPTRTSRPRVARDGAGYCSAALDGAQEVPPVATAGRGWGVVRFDPATSNVRIFCHLENLTSAPIAAHLHQGAVGVNGGILVPPALASPNALRGQRFDAQWVSLGPAANPSGFVTSSALSLPIQ